VSAAKRILVTGGRGFIGTNLVRELRSRGHEVTTVDLAHADDPQHVRADVRYFRQMERVFEKQPFDYVYHLAAEYGRWNGEDYYEPLWETNNVGTKHMIRLQEKHRFRMIFFSSCEVYGDYDGLMSEDVMDRVPIRQMNDYAISKWAGELQVLNSATMFKTESVRVRPLNCYGPHEHYSAYRGVIPIFVYRALKGLPYTVYSGHKRIFDYVDDTVRTFANIVDHFIPGEVYNVGGRREWVHDIREVSDIVLKACGADDRQVTYAKAEAFTTRVKIVDMSRAERDLKHDPGIDLEEGIGRYVRWMRATYGDRATTMEESTT
jgi:dTDP-glucose 4,6-dehydratase